MNRPSGMLPFVLIAAAVLFLAWSGCGGGGEEHSTLDSLLTRVDGLRDAGREREARQVLHARYREDGDDWQGASAPDALRLLAELYAASAMQDSALHFYERAGAAWRALARRDRAYEMTIAAGALEVRAGRPDRARALYDEALRLALVFGDSAAAQELRHVLLPVVAMLEDGRAEQEMTAALLAFARARQDVRDEVRTTMAAGRIAMDRGDHAAAIDAFLRAVALANATSDSLAGTHALTALGTALDAAGRVREALDSYGTALRRPGVLAADPALRAELHVRTGDLYLRRGERDLAARFYRPALALARDMQNGLLEAWVTVRLGQATLLADRTAGQQLLRSAYDQFRSYRHAPGLAVALRMLGAAAEQENRMTDALELYTAAATEQEKVLAPPRATSILAPSAASTGTVDDPQSALVALLMQTGRVDEGFAWQQRKNSHALRLSLAHGSYVTGASATDSLLALCAEHQSLHRSAERALEEVLSTAPARMDVREDIQAVLDRTDEAVAECAEELTRVHPAFTPSAAISGPRPDEVRMQLPPGSALLTFIPAPRAMHVVLITPEQAVVRVSSRPGDAVLQMSRDVLRRLEEQVAAVEAGSRTAGPGPDLTQLSRGLYEALLLPVESLLRPGLRLFVLFPDGMPPIPVHALRPSPTMAPLIERMTVEYLTSLRIPEARAVQPAPRGAVTCLGFAGASGWDVEYELRDVKFFTKDARMLFGRAAVLDSLRAGVPDLLHMAVDIRYGRRVPLYGSFQVSDGVSPTGTRTVPLPALIGLPGSRIVLLSNLSPAGPFFDPFVPFALSVNGTAVTVANLTPATRAAKKAFVEGFYAAWMEGVPPAEAVRRAQREMMAKREFAGMEQWGVFTCWAGR